MGTHQQQHTTDNSKCKLFSAAMPNTLSRQTSIAPQAINADEQTSVSDAPAAASTNMRASWPDAKSMLGDILPLTNNLEANDHTKCQRAMQCTRVVRHIAAKNKDATVSVTVPFFSRRSSTAPSGAVAPITRSVGRRGRHQLRAASGAVGGDSQAVGIAAARTQPR